MQPALHGAARLAVGLTRVSTAEQGHSGLTASGLAALATLPVPNRRAGSLRGPAVGSSSEGTRP